MFPLKFRAGLLGGALLMVWVAVPGQSQAPPKQGGVPMLTEPETGGRFPLFRTFPGKSELRLESLGVGHRTLFGVSYYSLALYVDLPALRKAMGGQGAAPEAMQALEAGGVSLCLDLQYTRGISGRRRGEVIRERMAKTWKGPGTYEKDSDAMKLVEFYSREAQRGDESFLWLAADGRLLLQEAGKEVVAIRSGLLRRFILETYLGSESVSQDLKRSLFSRLEGMLSPPGVP